MSGEDLTMQAGLAVQQDLALVNLLGIAHVERNGHHYVNGMAACRRPSSRPSCCASRTCTNEPRRRAPAHRGGHLAIGSLAGIGFATGAYPDWETLTPMTSPSRGTDRR